MKRAAVPLHALHPDTTGVRFDNLSANTETKAGSWNIAPAFRLMMPVKNGGNFFLRNADTAVDYLYQQLRTPDIGFNDNFAFIGAEFDGVGPQVDYYLLDAKGVGFNLRQRGGNIMAD